MTHVKDDWLVLSVHFPSPVAGQRVHIRVVARTVA